MKNHSLVVAVITFLSMASAADAKYSGGTGEPNDPYRIATPENLNDIGNYEEDWDKHFILINDVNLAQYSGTQFNIIGRWIWFDSPNNRPFTGIFDGNNHKIHNFTWVSDRINGVALFGWVGPGSHIKNIGMENVNIINAQFCVGGLVGYNESSRITNCYSTGTIDGSHGVGGLIGYSYEGTITNCYSTGNVSGTDVVGGVVGSGWGDAITNCYSTGSVGGGDSAIGGLVGQNNSMITNCYSTGSVGGDEQVGGLVGINSGTITNCYSTGSISANYDAAGLVGGNGGTISNCYSTGNVSATSDNVGGLVGYGGAVNSFWDIETSGQLTSAGGEPKTTAEMKEMRTFTDAGWDFVEIWGIGENQTYPFLRTDPAGDLDHDRRVDFVDLAIMAMHWLAPNNP